MHDTRHTDALRPAAVRTAGLVKRYESRAGVVEAVRGVDLTIRAGEVFGFLGPNGAGKSTTVRMLTTLLSITAGSAEVAGIDVARDPDAARHRIGVALQEAGLDPRQSGRELLILQGRLFGMTTADAAARAERRSRGDDLLERVGLLDAADRKVGGYSGGMRRRLDLAATLVGRPEVLFLDEPTTGLDPTSRAALWREVRSLNADGTTVFLTTQYLEEAEQLADRVGIIAAGTLVAEGTPAALKARVGEPTLHVELADPGSAERARVALAGLGSLQPPDSAAPCKVELRSAAGHGAIAPVIRALDEHNVVVESVEVESPTLDDVFAAVTGSHLEGAGAAA